MASKNELVRFLDERVFNPILQVSPEHYSGNKREDLKYVQDWTKAEKERYHITAAPMRWFACTKTTCTRQMPEL